MFLTILGGYYKRNSTGFEFADNEQFGDVATYFGVSRVYIDRLEQQVSQLQQENEQLKADYGNKAQVERDILLQRINKAIEYIEEIPQSMCLPNGIYDCRKINKKELLEILKGEREIMKKQVKSFKKEVEKIINKLGIDNLLDIPDFIIADYLSNCLEVLSVLENGKNAFLWNTK